MIDSIDFEGNTVKLGKLTVLVGPNDAGKTTLLHAIRSLHKDKICAERVLTPGALGVTGIVDHALKYGNDPCVILIDNMSDGSHMIQQVSDMKYLQNALATSPNMQAVVVTNSPFQLETVAVEDVRVMARRGNVTKVKSLAEHPELDRWRAGMDTSELWANLGEDWVFECD